jgi:hypothetical protein
MLLGTVRAGLSGSPVTIVTLHEVGMEVAPKRKCQSCGVNIPNWRKGRRVSKATRFCSDRCAATVKCLPGVWQPFVARNVKKAPVLWAFAVWAYRGHMECNEQQEGRK